MKKTILLMVVLAISITMTACISNGRTVSDSYKPNDKTTPSANKPTFNKMFADWTVYQNPQELINSSNLILIGKVTGVSFQMLDAQTGEAPTEKTEERDYYFHTIYDIDVITSYKGDASHITTVRLMGGIIGSFEDEQYALQAKYNKSYIPVFESNPEYKVGETYLFVLYKFETGAPTPLNIDQSVFNLHNPFKKYALGLRELDEQYYSENIDQKGNPIMSAMDVISALGQDKWDAFWSQWQADNPNWETWIDKNAVEMALTD